MDIFSGHISNTYVFRSSVCQITLEKPISMNLKEDNHTCLIAQRFPTFGRVSLRNKCVLTCDEQKDGLGGILAFGAKSLVIDATSKIDMSGKGTNKKLLIFAYQKADNQKLNETLLSSSKFPEAWICKM